MSRPAVDYNQSITAIKVIALLAIVFFHLRVFPAGSQGIIVFVACSGYNYSYLYKKIGNRSSREAFLHQASKLLLAVFLAYALMAIMDGLFFHKYSLIKIIASFFLVFLGAFVSEAKWLLDSAFYSFGMNVQLPDFPSNGVLWFVSLVLWLYLIFPILKCVVESIYRYAFLFALLVLCYYARNCTAFDHPYNSISANLFNFYVGMLVFRNETAFLDLAKRRKLTIWLALVLVVNLYVFNERFRNTIFTDGIIAFALLYVLSCLICRHLLRFVGWLIALNPLIMFFVFLHIPAQAIRDVFLSGSAHDDWRHIVLSYSVYFLYATILAIVANSVYRVVQLQLAPSSRIGK